MISTDLGWTTSSATYTENIEITTYVSTSSLTTCASRPTQVIRSYAPRSRSDAASATTKYVIVYRSSASTARPRMHRPRRAAPPATPRTIARIERATLDRRDRWLRVNRRRG